MSSQNLTLALLCMLCLGQFVVFGVLFAILFLGKRKNLQKPPPAPTPQPPPPPARPTTAAPSVVAGEKICMDCGCWNKVAAKHCKRCGKAFG